MEPLHVMQPNAAGIDIGATEIYVAVSADRDPEPVRCFATFTEDLTAAARWLKSCGIQTIAMESTGVYWIPVFQILEVHRFEHDGDNVHYTEELILHLVRTTEDVRIILRKATYTCQTVQLATLLVTANRTELCQTQRQVFVRTG